MQTRFLALLPIALLACDPTAGKGGGSSSSSTTVASGWYSTTTTSSTPSSGTTTAPEVDPVLTFVPGALWPDDLTGSIVADFNEDGVGDVVVFDTTSAHVFFGPLSGVYSVDEAPVHVTWPQDHPVVGIGAAGDFDGDGRAELWFGPDLVAIPDSGTIDATIAPMSHLTSGETPVAATDFDGDGIDDVVLENYFFADVRYGPFPAEIDDDWAGTPAPSDGLRLDFECQVYPFSAQVTATDLDGDGLPEVQIGSPTNPYYDYFGCNGISPHYLIEPGDSRGVEVNAIDVALSHGFPWTGPVGDIDGDGVMDFGGTDGAKGGVRSGARWAATGDLDGPLLFDTLEGQDFFAATYGFSEPLGDLDGDGIGELVVDPTFGGLPEQSGLDRRLVSGADLAGLPLPADVSTLGSPTLAEPWFDGVGVPDLDGDGIRDIPGDDGLGDVAYWSGAEVAAASGL